MSLAIDPIVVSAQGGTGHTSLSYDTSSKKTATITDHCKQAAIPNRLMYTSQSPASVLKATND